MEQSKIKKLEDAGWRVGSTADFLELSPEEQSVVEKAIAASLSDVGDGDRGSLRTDERPDRES